MVVNEEEVFGNASSIEQIIAQMKPKPPIKLPENLVVKNSKNSGELIVNVRHITRAVIYMFEYASLSIKGTITKRESMLCTENRYIFKGLTPGIKYQIRVGASAINDMVRYGDDVFEIVCE